MEEELKKIKEYLETHNLGTNRYRVRVGEGVSQCLGMVSKRSLAPDLSRQSWLHPELHHLLLDFANKHVRIPFTSIQVNCDFASKPHKDVGNMGDSYIIAFGDYHGGELCIEGADHDIRHKGLLFNGSEKLHWTKDWTGTRYSLVFHTLRPRFPMVKALSDYSAVQQNGRWVIAYDDGGEQKFLYKGHGLPHPRSKR